jgi:hypothetical protein
MDEFRIVSSQALNTQFETLCQQATAERRGIFALDVADAIMKKLSTAPQDVGEPLYHLKQMQVQMRVVAGFPWVIHFAVDEQRRIVYLSRIELMS